MSENEPQLRRRIWEYGSVGGTLNDVTLVETDYRSSISGPVPSSDELKPTSQFGSLTTNNIGNDKVKNSLSQEVGIPLSESSLPKLFHCSTMSVTPNMRQLAFVALVAFACLWISCTLKLPFTSWQEESLWSDDRNSFFVVVFDAGSTGTRIHVFHLNNASSSSSSSSITLVSETFHHLEPGLSAYGANPPGCRKSVETLLKYAVNEIPASKRPSTPLILKATAGLRLLPAHEADALLGQVRDIFSKYDFRFSDGDVSILDGLEEGIFGWITVNFLMSKFGGSRDNTVATMDLGGGSTQVTFDMKHRGLVGASLEVPPDFAKEVSVLGQSVSLYSHSYLGAGLMAARLAILRQGAKEQKISTDAQSLREFSSPCLPPKHKDDWAFGGVNYIVKGSSPSSSSCASLVTSAISGMGLRQLPRQVLDNIPIFAFSYYFDRALEAGLIDDKDAGGLTSVSSISAAAEAACRDFPPEKRPFLCMDLTYIASLLTDGLGFKSDDKIHLRKKIAGKEASWSLGAAFSLI